MLCHSANTAPRWPAPIRAMSDWIDGESEIGYNQVPTFPVSGGVGAGGDTESLATIEDGLRVLDLVDDDRQGKPASPHTCSYCGIDDKTCVVQCVGTQKWFCNSKRNGLPASCAVYHLVRSRSNEVRLHEDSPLGDMILECYLTGNRNVFNLGFAPCVNDDAVVLLARDAAMSASSSSNSNTSNQYYTQLKELNLDVTQWQPLVEDKKFLTWLVNDPDERDVKRALRLNASRVNKLEELWKTGQVEKTIDDVELVDAESEKAQPVALVSLFPFYPLKILLALYCVVRVPPASRFPMSYEEFLIIPIYCTVSQLPVQKTD